MPYQPPHSTGCLCHLCATGLAAYAPDRQAYDRALDRCRPTTLHVVTPGPPPLSAETTCTGSMTCECRTCSTQRAQIRPQGHGNANPFRKAA